MSIHPLPRQEVDDSAWADFELWHYIPSIPAAVIFIILFSILTAYHSYLLVRRRTWFCIPFVVGGFFEIVGYVGRALSNNNTDSVATFTMQSLALLLAPILFAASVYMVLGRIIRGTQAEHYSPIRVNWLTKIFVGGDFLCFAIQGAGGGMLSQADTTSAINMGNNIILSGLILQILIFCVFVVSAIIFQRRVTRQPTSSALDGPLGADSSVGAVGKWALGRNTAGWKRLLVGLYLTSVLIAIRNVFRATEYAMGWNSYLLTREWPLYLFDALLMVLVLFIGIMWYRPEISRKKDTNKTGGADGMVRMEGGESEIVTKERVRNEDQANGPWS